MQRQQQRYIKRAVHYIQETNFANLFSKNNHNLLLFFFFEVLSITIYQKFLDLRLETLKMKMKYK